MAQEIADSKLLDTWGSSGTKIEPDISKIIEGWQLGEQPPHEYMNWLQNTFGSKLNHILKNGIAKWNNETEYLAGASVQHSGKVWICKITNTNSEPTDLNANWEKVAINKDLTVTVDTLADLRSISYPANTVWASGYHAKNDGAFGSYIFRLKGVKTIETDNGGTVIITTIGSVDYVYELQYDGAVNVKWFGAKGDGVTDDTLAIQNALNSGNRNIFFPDGIYIVTSTLLLPTIGSFRIEGVGSNTIIKVQTGLSTDIFSINGNNGPLKTFRNLTFNGPSLGVYGGAAIGGEGNGVHIDNCWFAGVFKGSDVSGSYIHITNSTFEYCYYGIFDDSPIENIYANNVFYKCETDIYVTGTVKATIINGVSSIGCKTDVIKMVSTVGLVVQNVVVEDDGTDYNPSIIHIAGTSNHNIVSNISSKGHGNYLVFLEGSLVNHNLFSNLFAEGITRGIFISLGNYNNFTNFKFKSCTNGVRVDTAASNQFNIGTTESCDYGFYIVAAPNCRLVEVETLTSTFFGLDTPSTTTVYKNGCLLDSDNSTARGTTSKLIAYT